MEERCFVPSPTKLLPQLAQSILQDCERCSMYPTCMLRCLLCGSLEEIGNFYTHINAFVLDLPNGTDLISTILSVFSEIATVSLRIPNLNTTAFYGKRQAQYKSARWVFDSIAIANKSWWKEARAPSSI